MDYQKLYHILFNAVTDSLENMAEQNFGQAAACLRQARRNFRNKKKGYFGGRLGRRTG